MSSRVLKYRITVDDGSATFDWILGAKVLAAGVQQPGEICLWVDAPGMPSTTDRELRTFQVVGTGQVVPDPGTYVGTVFDGPFVWHVYEVVAS